MRLSSCPDCARPQLGLDPRHVALHGLFFSVLRIPSQGSIERVPFSLLIAWIDESLEVFSANEVDLLSIDVFLALVGKLSFKFISMIIVICCRAT